MKQHPNYDLSQLTSFATGGAASLLIGVDTINEITDLLKADEFEKPLWFLGFGTNVLISDEGLPGTTIIIKDQTIESDDNIITAAAGAEWDKVVESSVEGNLWGIEFMSGIPGGVGAAVVGNIAAYGQAIKDTLLWVETIDTKSDVKEIHRLKPEQLDFDYRSSALQTKYKDHIVLRAAFKLSRLKVGSLEYDSAVDVATDLQIDAESLTGRRKIILETRKRAGSIFDSSHKIAGSFFKNPVVDIEKAKHVASYDESGKTTERILHQQAVDTGNSTRASASLVLLAAGFSRGQSWGNVRLHPSHVLKVENTGGASSQDIYDVSQEIIDTIKDKLNIDLEPEVQFLGDFI